MSAQVLYCIPGGHRWSRTKEGAGRPPKACQEHELPEVPRSCPDCGVTVRADQPRCNPCATARI